MKLTILSHSLEVDIELALAIAAARRAAELVLVYEAFIALPVLSNPVAYVLPNLHVARRRPVVLIGQCTEKTVAIAQRRGSIEAQ